MLVVSFFFFFSYTQHQKLLCTTTLQSCKIRGCGILVVLRPKTKRHSILCFLNVVSTFRRAKHLYVCRGGVITFQAYHFQSVPSSGNLTLPNEQNSQPDHHLWRLWIPVLRIPKMDLKEQNRCIEIVITELRKKGVQSLRRDEVFSFTQKCNLSQEID